MTPSKPFENAQRTSFAAMNPVPYACVADNKHHLRIFLVDALEDLGFVTAACGAADELPAILDERMPDLVVLGLTADGIEVGRMLETLAARTFIGKILTIGPRDSLMVRAVRRLGEEYGLSMLPPLSTPFSAGTLRDSVVTLLPVAYPPRPAVDVGEALKAGWFELIYQRKIGAHSLMPSGAEASLRLRHPHWGVMPPECFVCNSNEAHQRALSEFVVGRAMEDWRFLLKQHGPVDLSLNLPIAFLQNETAVNWICQKMPSDPDFGGLLIEIDGADVISHLDLLIDVAGRVRPHKVAVSIDNLGTEWPALMHLDPFPFVEVKVASAFVSGCSDDRLKQTVCRRIVEFARDYGARTIATGVDSRSDYLMAYELGFDLVQGYLFGKSTSVKKFARTPVARTIMMPS